MRNVVTLGAFALAVTLSFGLSLGLSLGRAEAAPGPSKVGIIDLQRTLNETKAGKAAKTKLETQKNEKQKQLNEKKDALKKAADDFQKQKVVLKPDAAAKREQELQDEFAQLQNLYMQLQQDLAKQEAAATKEIWGKAGSIIESIAKRDGYTMIVERTEGGVFWADKSIDITEEVDKRLDAGEGGSGAAPAPGGGSGK